MAIQIIEKKPAELLNRENVVAKMNFDGATPSRADIKNQLAAQLKIDEKLIIISKIKTAFGKSIATIKAHVYKSEADLKKIEKKSTVKKNSKKKEEAPAEEAAPPAVEEKKE
ncbi:30S ribosomal protein S24e [Candidatus Woesearchaeota archaeon]|nr:30S ribosomal protein S24e [Candidatus Woesearchaeota archaeon]MBW3018199.1 30S ribosomal protein S24e [Candidatus Woesearchaeota archaeon]